MHHNNNNHKNNNKRVENKQKTMNLTEFYKQCSSKYEFASRVQKRTGVSLQAVLNWCKGYTKPSDEARMKVLSEESGIPVEELF